MLIYIYIDAHGYEYMKFTFMFFDNAMFCDVILLRQHYFHFINIKKMHIYFHRKI